MSKHLLLYYVRQEIFEYKEGAASSDDICITVINVSGLRKHSVVFSKLLLKNKAAVNTVLPLAHALLRRIFKCSRLTLVYLKKHE